uniref:Uncharacterized protein n=1 Tax=Mastacembelus armatus TaxID=205130 RepID=A0A7N8YHR0_9TELE
MACVGRPICTCLEQIRPAAAHGRPIPCWLFLIKISRGQSGWGQQERVGPPMQMFSTCRRKTSCSSTILRLIIHDYSLGSQNTLHVKELFSSACCCSTAG